MLSRRRARNRIFTVAVVLAITTAAGAAFALHQFPDRPKLMSIWIGGASSVLIGTPVVMWMLVGLETEFGRRLKQLPLLVYLAINSVVMAILLIGGHYLCFRLLWDFPGTFLEDPTLFESLEFSVALVVTVSLATELRRLIGPGVFGAVVLGRYRYPRAERRLFLMLDVVGSTGLAERLGPERFLAFLNRWIHVLTEPLLASKGRIYRYVGDEAILTWEWSADAADRALAFAVDATRAVAADTEIWKRDFGEVPRMRIALHGGPVIAGEMGDVKREITFLGDTLNTASRIAGEARHHDALVLASAVALDGVRLPAGLDRHDVGPVVLRGKAEPVPLVRLTSAPPSP